MAASADANNHTDPMTAMPKPLLTLIAGAALLLAGCSGVRLAYNTADFFIERYADDYLALDSGQMAGWSPTLDQALARHRDDELPYLAAFFNSAQRYARTGFTRDNTDCLLDQFEVIYRRHLTLAAAPAAALLADLNPKQINALERTFREEAREDAEDNAPERAKRRARKRAERYEDNLRWFVGDLSEGQRRIIADTTAGLPETLPWYEYRDRKRRELIALLRGRPSAARIEAFLVAWLVDYADAPAALSRIRGQMRDGFADLLVALDASLDAAQRAQMIDRLTRLRRDFLALQREPRMEPVGC